MFLRRELKLTYLAGIASLTIDQDLVILDRVALDLDLYAKVRRQADKMRPVWTR